MKFISDEDKPTLIIFIGTVLIFTYSMFSYYKKHEQETPSAPTETQQEQMEEQKISELKSQCENEYFKRIAPLTLDHYNPNINSIMNEYYGRCTQYAPKEKMFVLAVINSQIGNDYFNNSDFNNALVYYNKALQYKLKSNDKAYLDENYQNIGKCYFNTWEMAKAKEYFKKAYSINKNLNIIELLADSCYNLEQYDEANYYYNEGLKEIEKLRQEKIVMNSPKLREDLFYTEKKFREMINGTWVDE